MIEMLGYLWNTIELAAGVINCIVSCVNVSLACSAYIGKFIVDFVAKIFTNASNIFVSIFRGISVVYEDFRYFLSDIQNMFCFVESVFLFFYETIFNVLISIWDTCVAAIYVFIYAFLTVKDSVCGIYRYGLNTLYDCIYTFKGALILIGNVIWMCLMLIPGFFLYVISIFVFFINKCTEEIVSLLNTILDTIYSCVAEIFNFITDTPLEAICGLAIGFVAIYFCNKYKMVLLRIAYENLYKMVKYMQENISKGVIRIVCFSYFSFNKLKNMLNDVKETISEKYTRQILTVQNTLVQLPNDVNERLCVVCKDSETNIVIIPCKHMCLCEMCAQNPVFRRRRGAMCPVCRCEIIEILKVYL